MKRIGIVLAVIAAFVVYKFYSIPLPEEAIDTFPFRIVFSVFKLGHLKSDVYGYLYGKETKYLTWIDDMNIQGGIYVPKPERIEEGLKIFDTKFGHVPVRVYKPLAAGDNGPAVLFFHGGGWIVGSVERYDQGVRKWAIKLNMIVASVEYRLAPKYPYPVPFQDCTEAAIHFLYHAADFGADPERVALAGDSAGGNLAAAVSQKLRDIKMKPQPKLQVLLYPATQALDFNLPSYTINENDPLLYKELMVAMWLMYAEGNLRRLEDAMNNKHVSKEAKTKMMNVLNHDLITGKTGSTPQPRDGKQEVWEELKDVMLDPYFAPLVAEDLTQLPEALVYTVEQDVLRDEGILYAHRLKEAGNKVYHFHNRGGFHGIFFLERDVNSEDTTTPNEKIHSYIKKHL